MTWSEYWEHEDTRSESSLAEPIPPGWLLGRLVAETGPGGAEPVLLRLREVLSVAVQLEAEGQTELDTWRRRLPPWFVDASEAVADDSDESPVDGSELEDDAWPLESWAAWFDRTEDPDGLARCWRWWHAETRENRIEILLCVDGFPCPVDSLRWVVLAAGATFVSGLEPTDVQTLAAQGRQPRLTLWSSC